MLKNSGIIVALTVPKTKREPERKQGFPGYGEDFEAFGYFVPK